MAAGSSHLAIERCGDGSDWELDTNDTKLPACDIVKIPIATGG